MLRRAHRPREDAEARFPRGVSDALKNVLNREDKSMGRDVRVFHECLLSPVSLLPSPEAAR